MAQSVILLVITAPRIGLNPELSHVWFVMGNVEFEQAFLREFLALRCQCLYYYCLAIVYLNLMFIGPCIIVVVEE